MQKSDFLLSSPFRKQNTLAQVPSDKNASLSGVMVLLKVLGFVTLLLQDLASLQSSRRSVSLDPAMLGVSDNYASMFISNSISILSLLTIFPPSIDAHLHVFVMLPGGTSCIRPSFIGEDMESVHPFDHTVCSVQKIYTYACVHMCTCNSCWHSSDA